MIEVKVIVVGKIKEKYLQDAINEYQKRIKAYASLKLIEIKEFNTDDQDKNLNEEGKLILNEVKDDFLVTLEIEGKEFSSKEFAEYISHHFTYNSKALVFVIGSSCGLSEEVKKRSDYKLSFSKMTFPHQLMRVIFLEQLYRAFSIINNSKYHK